MSATAVSSSDALSHRSQPQRVSREGERTVVSLNGEQDIATVAALADTLAKAIADGDADLIVDLSGATCISAATIDVLIGGQDYLRQKSRGLTLRSPSRCARRFLDLCGLSDLVESQRREKPKGGSVA